MNRGIIVENRKYYKEDLIFRNVNSIFFILVLLVSIGLKWVSALGVDWDTLFIIFFLIYFYYKFYEGREHLYALLNDMRIANKNIQNLQNELTQLKTNIIVTNHNFTCKSIEEM